MSSESDHQSGEPENTEEEQNTMLAPPPGTFKDREELIRYVKGYAIDHGYVMTIKKSTKDRAVYLVCGRGGRVRQKTGELKRKRKASAKLINCPFEVRVRNGEHNHEAALRDISEHPSSRRFNEEEEEEAREIKEMIEAGFKPREVLETLKQKNPELKSTVKHVQNLKFKIRQGNFSERSFKPRPTPGASSSRIHPLKVSNFNGGQLMESEGNVFTNVVNPSKVFNFIGGQFVESEGDVLTCVVNPATQDVISQVPSTTYEEFKSAVTAAKQAFPLWKNTPHSARQRIMVKFKELIRRDKDKLALIISREQGETIQRAHVSILHGLEVIEHACGNIALQLGEYVPNASKGTDMHSSREPLGVCAGICESTYPAIVPLWMFPISITCGNTFVLKPFQESPGSEVLQ